MEQVAECIIITEKDGIIQYVNPALERITGFGRADTVGHHVRILKSNDTDPRFFKNISATLSRGESWHGCFSNKRKDGAPYELETMVSPVRDDSGDIVNYVIVARDVTNESRLERQLRQAQKMDAMGRLAGGIAHDFNNILAAIIGFTELALHSVPKENKAVGRLTEVLKAGARAKDLVKQILTFTRQSEQERKPLEVAPVVKETLKFLRASLPTTIEIRQNIEVDRAVIMADATQIHQILMNLSTNSAHAMEDMGGILEINLSTVELVASSASPGHNGFSGPCVKLVVSDTGHGMEQAVADKVFEPYFTTKPLG
jgi:PAS domain S-box-containing protein